MVRRQGNRAGGQSLAGGERSVAPQCLRAGPLRTVVASRQFLARSAAVPGLVGVPVRSLCGDRKAARLGHSRISGSTTRARTLRRTATSSDRRTAASGAGRTVTDGERGRSPGGWRRGPARAGDRSRSGGRGRRSPGPATTAGSGPRSVGATHRAAWVWAEDGPLPMSSRSVSATSSSSRSSASVQAAVQSAGSSVNPSRGRHDHRHVSRPAGRRCCGHGGLGQGRPPGLAQRLDDRLAAAQPDLVAVDVDPDQLGRQPGVERGEPDAAGPAGGVVQRARQLGDDPLRVQQPLVGGAAVGPRQRVAGLDQVEGEPVVEHDEQPARRRGADRVLHVARRGRRRGGSSAARLRGRGRGAAELADLAGQPLRTGSAASAAPPPSR